MREESELIKDIESAKQAESILNHPVFIAAIKTLREVTMEKFEGLGFSQTLEMQECNQRLNLIEELESNLETVIRNGNAAYQTLEDIQTHQQAIDNER